MKKEFHETGFARLYLWVSKAKFTMGIFFLAVVLFYLLLGFISSGAEITLDLFTAIQMMFACFFIGILQQAVLPSEKLDKTRNAIWVAGSVIIALLFSLIFKWFESFPTWCLVTFIVLLAMGTIALLLSYYLELKKETRRLNDRLRQYQNGLS